MEILAINASHSPRIWTGGQLREGVRNETMMAGTGVASGLPRRAGQAHGRSKVSDKLPRSRTGTSTN